MYIARLAGIPLRLHWSFLALVGGYVGFMGATGGAASAMQALGIAVVLFGSVVLHELGHAQMARAFGIPTANITLYPFGGIAAISRMPSTPAQEVLIALAGPAVNVVLIVPFVILWVATGSWMMAVAAAINVVMAVFNMLPAYPMDGGRVLRAALTPKMGFVRATAASLSIGRGFAWLFLLVGVVMMNPSLILVALFLHFILGVERRRLRQLEREMARAERWGQPRQPVARYRPRWRLDPPRRPPRSEGAGAERVVHATASTP